MASDVAASDPDPLDLPRKARLLQQAIGRREGGGGAGGVRVKAVVLVEKNALRSLEDRRTRLHALGQILIADDAGAAQALVGDEVHIPVALE